MNRVLRLTTDTGRADFCLANQDTLSALLRQHFPEKYQTLFSGAQTQSDGSVIWTSPLSGHPVPLSSAEGAEAQRYHRLLAERLNDIRLQAGQLHDKKIITDEEHQLLKKASVLPDTDSVFIINNQPVITWWPRTTPLPAAPVVPVVPAAAATATAVAATSSLRRWWSLLLLLLLLLLAGGTFLWMKGCNDTIPPVILPVPVPVEVTPPVPEPVPPAPEPPVVVPPPEEPPVAEPPPEEPQVIEPVPAPVPVVLTPTEQCLREKIHAEGLTETAAAEACRLLLSPPPVTPAKPVVTVKKPVVTAKTPAPEPVKPVPVRKVCPAKRKPEDSPQVFIIFDTSYSMILSLNLTKSQLQKMGTVVDEIPGFDAEPRRITVAKRAVSDLIKRIPSDMGITLVVASDCGKIRSTGNMTAAQRPELQRIIRSLEPDDGTPLADSITRVNKSIKNNNRDTVVILISDGVETCGKDPCAAAASLKRAHPKAVVNVVDIMGAGAGNCVARNTGGKVFTARNAAEIARKMQEAMNDYIPEGCN